ncbi:MAG: hypothetical protein KIT10_04575 [Flavobacteriales bacterium]|nr:hypothetical protein [Flavobacteriales bacterium]
MTRRWHTALFWSLFVVAVLLAWLYHRNWMPVARGDLDPALFSRGIATPLLLWLNGYLGVFFNLQFLGTMGIFALPLIVLAILCWQRLETWQRGLLVFTLLAVVVIGAFGGFNYRYALTLQPLFTVAVLAVVWRALPAGQRAWAVAGLAALSVLNTGLSLEHRQRTWHAEPTFSSPDTRPGTMKERLDSSPRDLEGWLSHHGVAPTDTVLVNNLPVWYYVTDRPGIYYWCGSDQLFLADGKPLLMHGRSDEEVVRYLLDSLHCRHIFSTVEYNGYAPRWVDLLERHAVLLAEDDRGHTLHRLKDTFGR